MHFAYLIRTLMYHVQMYVHTCILGTYIHNMSVHICDVFAQNTCTYALAGFLKYLCSMRLALRWWEGQVMEGGKRSEISSGSLPRCLRFQQTLLHQGIGTG